MTALPAVPGYAEHVFDVPRPVRYGTLGEPGPATRSLWCALHGYGERSDLMAARARWPVSPHRAWAFPEAPHRFYVTGETPGRAHQDLPVGASWMTRELREHDMRANERFLDAVVDHLDGMAPGAALTVLGFSQGAATATRWAAARAAAGRPPARLVVWGSLLPLDVALGADAPLRRVPLDLVMGTRDRWVSEERFAAEVARLAAAGLPVRVHRFDGGHRFDDALLARLAVEDGA